MYLKKFSLFLLALLLLGGCSNDTLPDNVVATVNGKQITLHTVQTLQEIEFIDFSSTSKPSLRKLRNQYGVTLSTIILYEIILQHLESQRIGVTDEMVAKYEKGLLEGYTKEEFDDYITKNAIDVDTWRTLLRYQLAVDVFKNMVLKISYVPSVEEVEAYYTTHKDKFKIGPSYTLHIASSAQKEVLDHINNLDELLKNKARFDQYELNVTENMMPKNATEQILALAEKQCTEAIQEGEIFLRICLVKKNKGENISISKAYSYIEDQIFEQRMGEMLNNWLEENTKNVEIKISKHLMKEIIKI